MAMNKFNSLVKVYESCCLNVTATPENWASFLQTACRNYKLRFDEQILIYNSRPDATAVLDFATWSKFGYSVNRGSNGIAVFEDFENRYSKTQRIRYYFDISDTVMQKNAKPVPVWEMQADYHKPVISALRESFGSFVNTDDLAQAVLSVAENITEQGLLENAKKLIRLKQNSFLEDLDNKAVYAMYKTVVKNSMSYLMLYRLGINPEKYIDMDDLRDVVNFNTVDTADILGNTVGTHSQICLNVIAKIVRSLQRSNKSSQVLDNTNNVPYTTSVNITNVERGFNNGNSRINLQEGRRRISPERGAATAAGGGAEYVRQSEVEVSQGTRRDDIPSYAREMSGNTASGGDSGAGGSDGGNPDKAAEAAGGRNGEAQGERPDGVGTPDEQHKRQSERDNLLGADLRLSSEPVLEQQNNTIEAEVKNTSAFSVPESAEEKYFRECDIAYLLAKGTLAYDEIESLGYIFYDDEYTQRYKPLEKAQYGTGFIREPEIFKLSTRYKNGEDISKELVLGLVGKADIGRISLFASGLQNSIFYDVEYCETGYKLIYGNVVREVSISDVFKSYMKLFKNEYESILYADFYSDLKNHIPVPVLMPLSEHQSGLYPIENARNSKLSNCRIEYDEQMGYVIKADSTTQNGIVLAEYGEISPPDLRYSLAKSGYKILIDNKPVALQIIDDTKSSTQDSEHLDYYDRSNEDKSLPFFGNSDTIREILATTPHLKATKEEILEFYESVPDSDRRTEYIKSIFNNDYTQLTLSDGRKVGYKTFQNVLHLWEGEYDSRTAQSFYDWGVIAQHFEAMRLLGELQDIPAIGNLIFDSEAEVRKPSAFLFSQEIIDTILTRGSGVSEGKLRIYEQFQKSLSKKENVEFLKNEYGWGGSYPVIVGAGIDEQHDGKGIRISKGIGNDKPHIDLSWDKVEKRIGELIKLERYLNPKEKAYYPEWLEKQEQRRIEAAEKRRNREILSTAPPKAKESEPEAHYEYHLGDKVYIGADEYEILSLDDDRAMLYDTKYPLFNKEMSREEFDQKIKQSSMNDHLKVAVQPEKEQETAQRDYSKYNPLMQEYFRLKDEHPDTIILYRIGEFLEAMGDDAELVSQALGLQLTRRRISSEEDIKMCGFPASRLETNLNMLLDREHKVGISNIDENHSRKFYLMESDRAHEPIQSHPVGRIDYINADGRIENSIEYTNPTMLEKDIKEENTFGVNYVSDEELAPFYEEHDELDDVEPAVIRQQLADAGIVNGELVDEDKLNSDPFIQQVMADAEAVADNSDLIGQELTLDERKFIVESVGRNGDVSMRDITFEDTNGFPIFRSEKVGFVRRAIEEQQTQQEEITPAWEKPKKSKAQTFDLHPEIPMADRHNFDLASNEIEEVGKKERFRRNMEAIRVLKECESDNRFATPEEQIILSKYVGWGGIPEAFDENNSAWATEYLELSSVLTPDEYAAASESTLTAFYTPPTVIKAVYNALEQLGFSTGNILEPSCGIGHFIGMLPDSMSESKIYGVELDSISAGIAQQLYQKSSIAAQPFEEANLPDSFFDAVVGNVPFGDFKVPDKRYDKHKFLIHDYFFAKSLDKLRPGGVMALITSKGTMDKKNPSVRKYIAQRAELLGAIRLPNNTFKGNAGTEVVSDILILQKRDRIIDIEPDWVHLGKDENGITMNSYFVDHSEMILGEMKMVSGRFGSESTCEPYEGVELENQLAKAVANIQGSIPKYEASEEITEENDKSIPADPTVRNYSYTVVDGEIYFRENSIMKPADVSATAENRIKGMIGVRDCVRRLVELQTEDYPDEAIKAEQSRLNTLYDDFVKKYGYINSRANNSAFAEDSSYPLLSSLEVFDDEGNFKAKADIFTKRTIKQKVSVTSVDTPSEALAISLAEKARIDMEYMSELTGKTESEIASTLKGVIFLNPLYDEDNEYSEKYLPADEYLSGNVREKLETARLRARYSPSDFSANVEALEKVQPTPLSASEISVRLGSTWVPAKDVAEFMFDLLNTPRYMQWNIKVHFSEYTGEWNIEGKSVDNLNLNAASTYGTKRINAYKIIEETLNLRDVRVFDTIENPDGKTERVLNKRETAIAQGKQEAIKTAFSEWIWKDPQRRERLCKLYNEKFNSIRPREYDGSHLNFVGINPEIQLKQHQVNAVAHILYGGNTLLAHVVGAGKTFEMVAAAQESKRLGLCRKSLIVVPNHLTEQWAAEYMQLYPAANILVARKKDFETKNRKRFCARIATGDYDAVIIGHSQLEKIPLSAELQIEMLNQQMDEIIEGISELKRNRGDSFSIKQLEKTKKTIKQKLDKLNDQSKKDDVVTFEELGVDRLFIDEAHYYKNLAVFTKMRNVGGISQTEAMKSSDLYMKCRYLDKLTGGRGVVFATGTPISNSMVEMYTMQKYLQSNTLRRNNLINFDAWASTFGETVTAMELAPEGNGYRMKTRFARFYNLPELMAMFKETADIQTADMLKLPVPKAEYHNVLLKPSEEQKAMVAALSDRAERVRNKMVAPNEDNMLLITNDGRKLALDQRLMNEMLPGSETGKTAACAENVFRIWQDTAESRSTQMVFCDLSTPHGDGKFNVYDDLREKLIAKGIPKEEIAYIHSAKTEVAKKELFGKVRSGKIRVLLGSTQKMGAGTNVQQKLKALHHLDCPWRPSDLQQREGRIIRRGNENSKVDIYTYVTENTFDSYLYQLVESKQKFIGQIMTSKSPVRSAEDIDETALSYAEIKALCSGNPHIKEKMDLDIQVQKLKMLKANFLSEKYNLEDRIAKYYPQSIIRSESIIEGLKLDIQRAAQHPLPADKEQFVGMIINGVQFTDKKDAGAELIACCKKMQNPDPVAIGEYRGFTINLYFDTAERQYAVNLKGERGYSVTLGTDVFGNISRINNAIDGIERQLERAKLEYESLQNQLQTAKEQVVKPFPQEEELQAKTARLNELNALITLDNKKGNVKEATAQSTPQHSAPKRRR